MYNRCLIFCFILYCSIAKRFKFGMRFFDDVYLFLNRFSCKQIKNIRSILNNLYFNFILLKISSSLIVIVKMILESSVYTSRIFGKFDYNQKKHDYTVETCERTCDVFF